jgi:hypothetical protein
MQALQKSAPPEVMRNNLYWKACKDRPRMGLTRFNNARLVGAGISAATAAATTAAAAIGGTVGVNTRLRIGFTAITPGLKFESLFEFGN